MLFDPEAAVTALASVAHQGPWPEGAPEQDFVRSPCARQVGQLAAGSGLFLFDFEQRAHLSIPEGFLPEHAPSDAGGIPEWEEGQLPEPKYQSFRHDLRLGSFHPGHRGKWTTHELCHALVGFAWHPNATPLFHATAGRLAELLPVVLYYFLDEVGLTRCPDHAGGGPLFRDYCPQCEDLAGTGSWVPGTEDVYWLTQASTFLDRELAAVARTRRLGRPMGHRWGSLDLCTDGIAYAAAHGRRLTSQAFHQWQEGFSEGYPSLEALEERVVEVARALVMGEPLVPQGDRWTWIAQDLGWRSLVAAEHLDGERARCARSCFEILADGDHGPQQIQAAHAAWQEAGAHAWPVFAVGYDPGVPGGRSLDSVRAGLASVVPLSLAAFEDAGHDPIPAFAGGSPPLRRPIGDRFADWLGEHHPSIAPLARFEAALRHVRSDGLAAALGPASSAFRLADGARVLDEPVDAMALAESVEAGESQGMLRAGQVVLEPEPAPGRTVLVVLRDSAGDVGVMDLEPPEADMLLGCAPIEPARLALWQELGMVQPSSWPLQSDLSQPEE